MEAWGVNFRAPNGALEVRWREVRRGWWCWYLQRGEYGWKETVEVRDIQWGHGGNAPGDGRLDGGVTRVFWTVGMLCRPSPAMRTLLLDLPSGIVPYHRAAAPNPYPPFPAEGAFP